MTVAGEARRSAARAPGAEGCVCPEHCATLEGAKRPAACPAQRGAESLERALAEYRREDSLARRFWQAFTTLVGHGGASRSRLEHIMEFSRAAGFSRLGLAGCARYLGAMHGAVDILERYGFSCMIVACKVGGNRFADLSLEKDSDWTLCNPLGQASLLNDWGSHLNIAFGLCMGHDLIFQHYSEAPVTTLVVKEKISDDQPLATLRRLISGERGCSPYMRDER